MPTPEKAASGWRRFAPSTTGPAHPGTLLAALLCWLDARQRGAPVGLRLEDLDRQRCRPVWAAAMRDDLQWLGLDWDAVMTQSEHATRHAAALDALAARGLLYLCRCSRADLRAAGRRAPDGGFAYDNVCRSNRLREDWRSCSLPLRVELPDTVVTPIDWGGLDLRQNPARVMGDPVVRRRDGAVAYQLAVVVDDAAAGVSHVVRGRDIAPSTATQVALMRLLGLSEPTYRHHLLLCESRNRKLAKLHGAVGMPALQASYSAEALLGFLAHASGLQENDAPCELTHLLAHFDWHRVARNDVLVHWDGRALHRL